MNIVVYETEQAGPKKFLAHVNLGNDIYMSFFGAYQVQAVERAEAWYARERAHQLVLEAGVDRASANLEKRTGINPSGSGLNPGGGRGAHFIGKVWMIHQVTRAKVRVPAGEVAGMEATGYVRGGPRSK